MGYEILYDLQTIKRKKIEPGKDRFKIVLSILTLAIVAVAMHWLASFMQMHLLGQTEAARTATEQMVENLKAGSDLKEAITAFCTEILK